MEKVLHLKKVSSFTTVIQMKDYTVKNDSCNKDRFVPEGPPSAQVTKDLMIALTTLSISIFINTNFINAL